jgi:hypothetical protein
MMMTAYAAVLSICLSATSDQCIRETHPFATDEMCQAYLRYLDTGSPLWKRHGQVLRSGECVRVRTAPRPAHAPRAIP